MGGNGKMKTGKIALVILGLGILSLQAFLVFADRKCSLEEAPVSVRQTIEKHAEGGKIVEIEIEMKDNKEIFCAEILKDGKEIEILVSKEGEFLGFDEEDADDEDDDEEDDEDGDDDDEQVISLDKAPESVQATIRRIVGNNPLKKVVIEDEDGIILYEAEYMVEGIEQSIECAASGEILEEEKTVDANAIPAAAMKRILQDYPGSVIVESESIQKFFYEIKIDQNGKKHEIQINAAGEIFDDDDD